MITVNELKFGYRKTNVFSGLNFTLQPGSVCGLLGENGVGKTTLLNLLSGLLFPNAGKCEVNGMIPAKRQLGFLKQTYLVGEEVPATDLTGAEYLRDYVPFHPKFSRTDMDRFAGEFNIDLTTPLNQTSYGSRKKFFLAFAFAANTALLLLDEPTNGLDIRSKAVLRKIVAESVDEEKTIVISTHQVRELENLIDPILIITKEGVALNQSIDAIREKLFFSIVQTEPEDTLYRERTPGGWACVTDKPLPGENIQAVDVQLEMLFNAVLNNPERMQNIFAGEAQK